MASSSTKSMIALFVFSLLLISNASFAEPPSYSSGDLPRLCSFDDLYKPEGYQVFRHIDTCNVGLLKLCKLNQIYQFGDSISDVGNLIRETPATPLARASIGSLLTDYYGFILDNLIRGKPVGAATPPPYARLPYGSDFPKGPTGRASNGNLLTDFYAMDAGLPLLPPFKKYGADFSHGVNFAVAGSTALPWEALAALNISSPITNSSLSVQLDWMSAYFHSLPNNMNQRSAGLENALFMMGPFGGSDYHHALFQGKSIHEIETTMVPKIVDAIMSAVRRVVSMGAKKVVLPGLYTIFRLPVYRTAFYGNFNMWEVNNDLAIHHNAQLIKAINKFNQEAENPNAVVVYGDYFSAYEALENYSVDAGMDLNVCCGSGGTEDWRYNLDLTRMCGTDGVSGCAEPKKHVSWDGENLTEEAYRIMAKYMVYRIFTGLQCPYSY